MRLEASLRGALRRGQSGWGRRQAQNVVGWALPGWAGAAVPRGEGIWVVGEPAGTLWWWGRGGARRIDQKAGVSGGRCRKGEVPGKTPVCSLSPQVQAKHLISLAFEIHLVHLYQFVVFFPMRGRSAGSSPPIFWALYLG